MLNDVGIECLDALAIHIERDTVNVTLSKIILSVWFE